MKAFTLAISLLLGFALSGCSVVNSLRMMNANSNIKPEWSESKPYIQKIESRYIGEKPYIKVTANGTQELLFLIDTGASFSMIFDTPAVKKLKFERGFSLNVAGWGEGEDTPAYQTQLSELALGNVKYTQVNLAYIPISESQYYHNPNEAIFDGVIGHDLMRHFVWTFDKLNNEISISSANKTLYPNDTILPIDTTFSKIAIPAEVYFNEKESTKRNIVIDTGSRHYIKLNSAFVEANVADFPKQSIAAADFGMSGKAEHKRVTLPKVILGKLSLDKVKANIIKSEDEDDWWVLGSALLNQFVTIIDYPKQEFVFRTYPDAKFKTKYNLAGIDLRKLRNGQLFVKYVFPELPGQKAKVVPGNIVLSINGEATENISEEDWLNMASTPNQFTMCFIDEKCSLIETKEIEGYSVL